MNCLKNIVLIVATIGAVTGCNQTSKESVKQTCKAENLAGVVKCFEKEGIEVGKTDTPFFTMIGAIDGIKINSGAEELYEYKTVKEAAEYGKILKKQSPEASSVSNGKFLLMIHEGETNKDKIVKTFEEIN
jgi:hypothetical protein